MTAETHLLRMLAAMVSATSYVVARARNTYRTAIHRLRPTAGWRVLRGDGLILVPPDWGELERDPVGVLVAHNRPRPFRIDGDAVWYSSAIELRVFPDDHILTRNAEAMTIRRRTIALASSKVTVELAVANGIGPRQRALAERVFRSAKPTDHYPRNPFRSSRSG